MTDLAAIVNAAFAYANEPSDAATVLGPPSEQFRLPATRGVLEFGQTVETEAELNEVLRRIAPTVGVADPFKAAIMGLLCGTLIEWGADPAELAPLLLARLPSALQAAESVAYQADEQPGEEMFARHPDGFRAWQGLSLMLLATMAVLARGMEFRQLARKDAELLRCLEVLRERNREAAFVGQTLDFTDGMELVVLHSGEGRGFRVELEAVNTNFHLFTLLQGELIGGGHLGGKPVDPNVIAVARGEVAHETLLDDVARFHFYHWGGLQPDGTFAATDANAWVHGGGTPEEIPEFEGERVLLLGPPVMASRSWDSNFFANIHDALRSAARVVEVLTAEQTAYWIERIRKAPR